MDLRELRYFVYVAEVKSFSKAAVHLRVAQPALSRQVRKLEAAIGVDLFVRTGRGIHLTPSGTILHRRALTLLRQAAEILEDVRAGGEALAGTVSVGVVPAAGAMLLPSVVRVCEERHPGIRIDIVEGGSGYLHERLLNQELTLGLLHNPAPHRDLAIHPLLVDHVCLVGPGPGAGPLPPCDPDFPRMLDTLPLILPSRPHSLRLLVENALARRGRTPIVRQQVDGLMMIKALVRAGVGYTVVTHGTVADEVEAGLLSAVPLDTEFEWTLCMGLHRNAASAPVVGAVMDIVRSEVGRLVSEGRWRGVSRMATTPVEPRGS